METEPGVESRSSQQRAELLREAVEVLTQEIALVSKARWEELPALKKKKVVLASRLRAFPPHQSPTGLEAIPPLVAELEDRSQRQIEAQMRVLECQIAALHEIHQYCLECLNVPLRKYC